jgi:hypothetical protein
MWQHTQAEDLDAVLIRSTLLPSLSPSRRTQDGRCHPANFRGSGGCGCAAVPIDSVRKRQYQRAGNHVDHSVGQQRPERLHQHVEAGEQAFDCIVLKLVPNAAAATPCRTWKLEPLKSLPTGSNRPLRHCETNASDTA